MTTTTHEPAPVSAPADTPPGGLDGLFGRFWPERPGSAGGRDRSTRPHDAGKQHKPSHLRCPFFAVCFVFFTMCFFAMCFFASGAFAFFAVPAYRSSVITVPPVLVTEIADVAVALAPELSVTVTVIV